MLKAYFAKVGLPNGSDQKPVYVKFPGMKLYYRSMNKYLVIVKFFFLFLFLMEGSH